MNGAELFKTLLKEKLEFQSFEWLENRGLSEFELLVSVILTQNTNWNNVLKALSNLKNAKISSLESLAKLENAELALLIKPSGFYNTKAKRLKNLVEKILDEFESLENFKENVSREWLLRVKGLGYESVDSILNYLCKKEFLVVDSYTLRISKALGYEFEDYESLREFCESGIENEQESLNLLLNELYFTNCNYELYELYQIFHALLVAFGKAHFKGAKLSEKGKEILGRLN